MYPEIKTRFIQVIGAVATMSRMWMGPCTKGDYHWVEVELIRLPLDQKSFTHVPEATPEQLAKLSHCKACGAECPVDATSSRSLRNYYNTLSGAAEPGDLYFSNWRHGSDGKHCYCGWTNCDGLHLFAVCPNGQHWDIDSRANNCTLPDETTHRCWVRHGDPTNLHVDKNGHTCQAGAGSIQAGEYHGYLHNGKFVNA